jgi:hypothetical protein
LLLFPTVTIFVVAATATAAYVPNTATIIRLPLLLLLLLLLRKFAFVTTATIITTGGAATANTTTAAIVVSDDENCYFLDDKSDVNPGCWILGCMDSSQICLFSLIYTKFMLRRVDMAEAGGSWEQRTCE